MKRWRKSSMAGARLGERVWLPLAAAVSSFTLVSRMLAKLDLVGVLKARD
jgi:hypothetical protein